MTLTETTFQPQGNSQLDQPLSSDSDGDGINDSAEGTVDTDGDQVIDALDEDSDNDGIPDSIEGSNDLDGDGVANYLDEDDDGDGILSANEHSTLLPLADIDGDGLSNAYDEDSDGDGASDSAEGAEDSDSDGVPNFMDPDDNDSPDADADGDGISNAEESVLEHLPTQSTPTKTESPTALKLRAAKIPETVTAMDTSMPSTPIATTMESLTKANPAIHRQR